MMTNWGDIKLIKLIVTDEIAKMTSGSYLKNSAHFLFLHAIEACDSEPVISP